MLYRINPKFFETNGLMQRWTLQFVPIDFSTKKYLKQYETVYVRNPPPMKAFPPMEAALNFTFLLLEKGASVQCDLHTISDIFLFSDGTLCRPGLLLAFSWNRRVYVPASGSKGFKWLIPTTEET